MKLNGLKVNFLGDSITEGVGVADIQDVYWNVLKRECAFEEARCYGIGGTRIAIQHYPENEKWDQDFIGRIDQMDSDADVIVVFGGTNDFGHGDAPLGCMSDRSPYTFFGACHLLCRKLMMRYPNAQIVLMTPLHRLVEERGGKRLLDYVHAELQVAEYYAIPILNLFAVSGIQPQLEDNMLRFCPDGLHPNADGHKKIASRLKGFLSSL